MEKEQAQITELTGGGIRVSFKEEIGSTGSQYSEEDILARGNGNREQGIAQIKKDNEVARESGMIGIGKRRI